MHHEVKTLLRSLSRQGWTWERRKSGHIHVTAPNGRKATMGCTPSDHRAMKNTMAMLRRMTAGAVPGGGPSAGGGGSSPPGVAAASVPSAAIGAVAQSRQGAGR